MPPKVKRVSNSAVVNANANAPRYNTGNKHVMGAAFAKRCKDIFDRFSDEDFYSDKVQHIYLYGDVSTSLIANFRHDLLEANTTVKSNAASTRARPKPIVVHVHSPGGNGEIGITLVNLLRECKTPIATVVDGYACSAITPLLVASPYRVMHSHSFVLIHEGSITLPGRKRDGDFSFISDHVTKLNTAYLDVYKRNTNIPDNVLQDLVTRDRYLDATSCKKWGIVDRVMTIAPNKMRGKWNEYLQRNPEYRNINLLDANNNHLSKYTYSDTMGTIWKFYFVDTHFEMAEFIQPLQNILMNNNPDTIQPVVFHANWHMFSTHVGIYDIATVLIRIAMCRVPLISVIDGDIHLIAALPCIMCHKRYMYSNVYLAIELTHFHHQIGSYYYDDIVANTNLIRSLVANLLQKTTKMPKDMLDDLFNKRVLLSAKDCLKYGLVDEILEPHMRGGGPACGMCSHGLPI